MDDRTPTIRKVAYELRADGRRPAWRAAQAVSDGKRQGFAFAPSGYGRKTSVDWYNGEPSVIGVRGALASVLFDDPLHPDYPHALVDQDEDWVARYGFAGLEGYGWQPGVTRPVALPFGVPFFIPVAAVPPGRRVATLKNGMRYVVPEGVDKVAGEVAPRT